MLLKDMKLGDLIAVTDRGVQVTMRVVKVSEHEVELRSPGRLSTLYSVKGHDDFTRHERVLSGSHRHKLYDRVAVVRSDEFMGYGTVMSAYEDEEHRDFEVDLDVPYNGVGWAKSVSEWEIIPAHLYPGPDSNPPDSPREIWETDEDGNSKRVL